MSVPFRFPADLAGHMAAFRDVLRETGFTKTELREHLAAYRDRDGKLDLDAVRVLISDDSPLHQICRLFLVAGSMGRDRADAIFGSDLTAALLDCGILKRDGGRLRSEAQLTPIETWWVLSDFGPEVTDQPFRPDFVLGVGAASMNLAGLTPRHSAADLLDLGSGGGIQALIASEHARAIVATDTNARALNFGRMNMAINGVEHVDFRPGSLYDPVQGERFDLVVSNPPFVISPDRNAEFRTATELSGDEIVQAVVRGATEKLKPGGTAVVLLNWHHENDDDWADKPLSWCDDPRVGRWLMGFDTESPLAYARRWLRDGTEHMSFEAFRKEVDRWLDYYRDIGVGRVSAGAVVLRETRGGPSWTRVERTERKVLTQGMCGDQIDRVCRAECWLAANLPDETMLAQKFRPAHDIEIVQSIRLEDGSWTLQSGTLQHQGGFEMPGSVDPVVMQVMEKLDGKRALRDVLSEVGVAMGVAETTLFEPACKVLRNLFRQGHVILDEERKRS